MNEDFIDSAVYAQGEAMVNLGLRMMNPDTRIGDLVNDADRAGGRLEFRIVGNLDDYVRDDEREG